MVSSSSDCEFDYLSMRAFIVGGQENNINDELRRAGWYLRGDTVETLKNWKDNYPKYVLEQCRNNCWNPTLRLNKRVVITRKRNDVIRRMI